MNSNHTNSNIIAHKVKPGLSRLTGIKNIVAITSGKGGVGKSTISLNLAVSLANLGYKIGILDCDIYGPSLPLLLGCEDFKPEVENNNFVPLTKYNLKAMSFGFLVNKLQPVIWRGAIVNKAIDQMLNDTLWGELDCLIIDMPPGTGDIQLTLAQKMPLTATIVITTPQDIALLDVSKSVAMFNKLNIPCLGVIENMSTHTCEACGHTTNIFASNGNKILNQQYGLDLLGTLPLNKEICTLSDNGTPVAIDSTSQLGSIFITLSINMLTKLAKLPKDYSASLANIMINSN